MHLCVLVTSYGFGVWTGGEGLAGSDLTDRNNWHWNISSQLIPITYSNWYVAEPNGDGSAMEIIYPSRRWNDASHVKNRGFVCEVHEGTLPF